MCLVHLFTLPFPASSTEQLLLLLVCEYNFFQKTSSTHLWEIYSVNVFLSSSVFVVVRIISERNNETTLPLKGLECTVSSKLSLSPSGRNPFSWKALSNFDGKRKVANWNFSSCSYICFHTILLCVCAHCFPDSGYTHVTSSDQTVTESSSVLLLMKVDPFLKSNTSSHHSQFLLSVKQVCLGTCITWNRGKAFWLLCYVWAFTGTLY